MSQVPVDLAALLGDAQPAAVELQSPEPPKRATVVLVDADHFDSIIEFPITPAQLPETGAATAKTFNVIGAGSYSFPAGRGEHKFTLQGYFPGVKRYDTNTEEGVGDNLPHIRHWKPPEQASLQLRNWVYGKTRLRYKTVSLAGTVDWPVFISSYTFTKTGSMGDITFQVELTEWRSISLIVDNGGPTTSTAGDGGGDTTSDGGSDQPQEPVPTTYSVLPGDTLSLISKKFLGDSGRWREIYDLNVDTIGPNPNAIRPGQQLSIPGGTVGNPDNSGYASSGSDATQETEGADGSDT